MKQEKKTKGKGKNQFASPAEDVCRVKVKIVARCHELDRNLHRHRLFECLNGVNRQMTKKLTVNRQKRNIFTVNCQMSEPILTVKSLRYP